MQASWQQRTTRFALSTPVQAGLYLVLWTLIIWLVYFSTYPAVHNTAHSLRHHTAGVGCH
ncbi:CbtB-domain containing protein [Leptolyngbyaceae cyanobacterium UHCC 1019]